MCLKNTGPIISPQKIMIPFFSILHYMYLHIIKKLYILRLIFLHLTNPHIPTLYFILLNGVYYIRYYY